MGSVLRRRRRLKKAAQLARLLAELDSLAAEGRPEPVRRRRALLGARL